VVRLSIAVPAAFDQVTDVLQIGQSWGLFAPRPTHWERDFRLLAIRPDGATADLNAALAVPLVATVDGALRFASHRWLKFFTQFDQFPKAQRDGFGAYLCRQAERHGLGGPATEFRETKRLIEPAGAPEQAWTYRYRFACPA
jgi:hypothetical protein